MRRPDNKSPSFLAITYGLLDESNIPEESRLKADLLKYYDPSVRPAFAFSNATRVAVDIALQQIIDVDEKQQLVQAAVWMRLYWKDEYMTWNPADYGNVASVKFLPEKLWLPDICIYDALEPAVHANEMQDFYVSIDHKGNVLWLSPLVIQSVCHLNVRYFPYDTQFCNITIGSWIYHGNDVDLWNKNEEGDITAFKSNVEWEVTSFGVIRTIHYYGCCPEPYPVVDFTLIIQRRPGFYITYLYIPSVVIIVSSLFAFYLPPGSDAKVDLGVTGLLSQTVFLLLISDLMPPDSHNPPLLGICLTMLLLVQAIAVVVIVIIKRVHDDSVHKKKPPKRWMYTLMNYLKYPFLLHHINYKAEAKKYYPSKPNSGQRKKVNAEKSDPDPEEMTEAKKEIIGTESKREVNPVGITNGAFMGDIQNASSKQNGYHGPTFKKNGVETSDDIDSLSHIIDFKDRHSSAKRNTQDANRPSDSTKAKMELLLKHMLSELKEKRARYTETRNEEEIVEQWQLMTAMYDRLFFVIFLGIVGGISIWFLSMDARI
ncbi:neuronal acetylcholine receptor subunit alpha-10-like [Watersipora subatra]|uniref:neuronal acetylcholine receptor subunit alpha-10-like n=1 Tax=Watersipora subatra TaxID=2589382 RepID=UPI00355B01E4